MNNINNFEGYLKQYGVENPDDPRHNYDYKKAFESGITPIKWKDLPEKDRTEDLRQVSEGLRNPIPKDAYMWPDIGKTKEHPIPAKGIFDFSKIDMSKLKDKPKSIMIDMSKLKDKPIAFGGGKSRGAGASETYGSDLPKFEPMSTHTRMQVTMQRLMPAFYRRQQRREQVVKEGLTNYMKYSQPAFKWAVSGMPEEDPERFMKMSWADVIRETYPIFGNPENPLARSVAVQFGAEVAGELLDLGTRPSTYAIWGATERLMPPTLRAIFKKLPKGMQETLIKERFVWGRHPVDLAYKELGLKKGASVKAVNKAYRGMASKWHPDKAPAGQSMKYTHKFLKGQGAYDKIRASTEIIRQGEILNKRMGLPTPKEEMARMAKAKSITKPTPQVKPTGIAKGVKAAIEANEKEAIKNLRDTYWKEVKSMRNAGKDYYDTEGLRYAYEATLRKRFPLKILSADIVDSEALKGKKEILLRTNREITSGEYKKFISAVDSKMPKVKTKWGIKPEGRSGANFIKTLPDGTSELRFDANIATDIAKRMKLDVDYNQEIVDILNGVKATPKPTPTSISQEAIKAKAEGKSVEEFVKGRIGSQEKYIYGENQLSKLTPAKWKEQFPNIPYKSKGTISIYRGAFLKDRYGIKEGDWVTLDKKFAKENYAGEGGKVFKKEVLVSELMLNMGTSQPNKSELIWKPEISLETYDSKGGYIKLSDKYKQSKAQLTDIYNKAGVEEGAVKASAGEVGKEIPKGKTTRPIITQSQKDSILKKKAIKQKQITVEKAEDAKRLVHSMVVERRLFLNSKNYDTNLFVNSIEQKTTKLQRELIPFILEKTDIPKELNRPDLVKLYEKESDNLSPIASQIKKHFDDSWKFMQDNSDDISVRQIENYVTHLWEFPNSKKQAITNWFVTQNKFLKKRHIETYKKGIVELGLKPKTLNILEIIRVHDNIMNKVIANKRFVADLKNLSYEGVPLIARVDKAPENWVYFDHPALRQGMVIPGKLVSGEKVSEELKSILYEMGVAIGRRISPVAWGKPTQVAGLYQPGAPPEIRLQRFFENSTVAHEIGHHLDVALGLGKEFLTTYKDELYAINRERIERLKGRVGKYGGGYARSTEEQIAEFFATLFTNPDKTYKLAPNAMSDVLDRLKKDDTLSKLVDFDFETKAKNLIEEQLNTMVKLPVRVHPDLEKPLKVIFDSRFDHEVIRAYEAINGILKKSKLSLSLFHHTALGETGIATMGLIKTLNIYLNPVKIYKAMVKGEFDIFKKEEIARKWIGRGLQVGATADIPVARIQRGLDTFRNNTKNIPVLNRLSQFIASFNEAWDKGLWSYLHDTLKLYGCEALGAKIDLTKDIIKQEQEVAQMVNDTFGGQNWDLLLVSPKTLQIASWFFLSPDWTTSTIRQALAPTGLGAIHKETVGLRRKLGGLFWLKAAIYFGAGINLLNRLYRKKDMKDNPQYYKDQEITFMDTTMTGNSIGHKTHLFVGRYKDGKERYVRWGKQFRELPEMFFDDTSFSPISASLKKMGGKTAPVLQLGTVISTGVSPSGFRERNIYGKRGWDRTWGIAKTLIQSPLPFSTRSIMQRDKEFKLTDLAMPSSKGMSRYKAIDLFKVAIERKDERLFKEVWQDSLRNKIPPYDMFKTALTILKATNTKEINSKIKTLDDIDKAFPLAKTLREKNVLRRRKIRLTKEKIQLDNGGKFLEKALRELTREDL